MIKVASGHMYEPQHRREVAGVYNRTHLELARIVTGKNEASPKHMLEMANKRMEQPRGLRTLAAFALGAGLTISFNGAKEIPEPTAPYFDTAVDCAPHGFQKVATPANHRRYVDQLYSEVRLKDQLTSAQCEDEFFEHVTAQLEPQFAMDTELGFVTPDTIVLPRFYTINQ